MVKPAYQFFRKRNGDGLWKDCKVCYSQSKASFAARSQDALNQTILDLIQENGSLTAKQIADELKVYSVRKIIGFLRTMHNRKLIDRIGTPGDHYAFTYVLRDSDLIEDDEDSAVDVKLETVKTGIVITQEDIEWMKKYRIQGDLRRKNQLFKLNQC